MIKIDKKNLLMIITIAAFSFAIASQFFPVLSIQLSDFNDDTDIDWRFDYYFQITHFIKVDYGNEGIEGEPDVIENWNFLHYIALNPGDIAHWGGYTIDPIIDISAWDKLVGAICIYSFLALLTNSTMIITILLTIPGHFKFNVHINSDIGNIVLCI